MKVSILSGLLLVFFLLPVAPTFAQEGPRRWAVGFRVGEPLGLNLRKYIGEEQRRAFDVNVGTYGGLWGVNRKYGNGRYKNVGLAVNANYLWLVGQGRFRPYYGFGGQITSRRSYPDRLNGEFERRMGIGGSGLAGIELFLRDVPASLFADVGLYTEVLPVPFFVHVQGGIGGRFNF